MAKSKWTIKTVEEFQMKVGFGSPEAIYAYLDELGAEELPQRKDGKYGIDYEGHFSYVDFWSRLALRHDVDLYSHFRKMGMPLISELEYSGRAINVDRSFEELHKKFASRHTYPEGVPEEEAAGIFSYFEFLLEDGWKPVDDACQPSRMPEFLLGLMPSNIALWQKFIDAGFSFDPLYHYDSDSVWEPVLTICRADAVKFMADQHWGAKNPLLIGACIDAATLDAAINAKLPIKYVRTNCSPETLVKCAHAGAKPVVGNGHMYPYSFAVKNYGSDYNSVSILEPGDLEICEGLNLEVIEAFCAEDLLQYKDAGPAKAAGRDDIVAIIEGRKADSQDGLSCDGGQVEKVITFGSPYLHDDVVEIPEGVIEIADSAFKGISFNEIKFPSTLKKIGSRAFGEGSLHSPQLPEAVTIPPKVKEIGVSALFGVQRITVYDTIDPKSKFRVDPLNGATKAKVGWLGVYCNPRFSLVASKPNSVLRDFEVTVKSAESDETLYRVWMPLESSKREVCCTYVSAWGPNAGFSFKSTDRLFDQLPDKKSKIRTALNRLLWPVDLSDENREKFSKYLSRQKTDAVKELMVEDELDGLLRLGGKAFITKKNAEDLLLFAKAGSYAPKIAEYLQGCIVELGVQTKAVTEKVRWNNDLIEEFLFLVGRADIEMMGEFLEGITGGKVPPAKKNVITLDKDPQWRVFDACFESGSVDAFEFLLSKGLKVDNNNLVDWILFMCCRDLNSLYNKKAKSFLMKFLDHGMKFTEKKITDQIGYSHFFDAIGKDADFYKRLSDAGLSFDGCDEEIVSKYLS